MTAKTQKTQLEVGDLVEVTTYGGKAFIMNVERVTKTKAVLGSGLYATKREIHYDHEGRPLLNIWSPRYYAPTFKLIQS